MLEFYSKYDYELKIEYRFNKIMYNKIVIFKHLYPDIKTRHYHTKLTQKKLFLAWLFIILHTGINKYLTDIVSSVKSFFICFHSDLRDQVRGGIATVYKSTLCSNITFKTNFDFTHTSFEVVQASITLQHNTLHFFCLYRPPPNRRNNLTDYVY